MSKTNENKNPHTQQVAEEKAGKVQKLSFCNAHTTVNMRTFLPEADIEVEAGGKVTFLKEENDGSWWEATIEAPSDKDLEMKLSALVFTPEDQS